MNVTWNANGPPRINSQDHRYKVNNIPHMSPHRLLHVDRIYFQRENKRFSHDFHSFFSEKIHETLRSNNDN